MIPTIIGISGRMQSGKDTLAKALYQQFERFGHHVVILPLAGALKEVVRVFFGATDVQVYGSNEQKAEKLSCGLSSRDILQATADRWRQLDDMCIIRSWERKRHDFPDDWYIIVPDVRFANEVAFLQAQGGCVIRLDRDPVKSTHVTETACDNLDGKIKWDLQVDNRQLTIEQCNKLVWQGLIDQYVNTTPFDPCSIKLDGSATGIDRRGEKGLSML
jgi:hypothetical protein